MQRDSLSSESLRRILSIGTSIKETCASASSPTISDPNPDPPPSPPFSLLLPSPPSIHLKLTSLGLSPHLADKLAVKYASRSEQLRSVSQNCLHRAWQELVSLPRHPALLPLPQVLNRVVAAHTASYARAVQALEQSALDVASRWRPRLDDLHKAKIQRELRQPFNQEFTPFLQKYFEYNAFPSAADRVEMAKKSMMEPRQIEVWFQNHRRRAKLEGRPVRKLRAADPAPLELCLKSMEEKMEPYLIPDGLRQSVDSEVSEAGSDDEEDEDPYYDEKPEAVDLSDPLNPPAARHAFPMPWARARHMVSIILPTQEFSFPPPEWPRKAAAPAAAQRPPVNMDDCIAAFNLFTIYDKTRVLSMPFQIPTTVIPPPAPLPALVRGKFAPSPVVPTTALNVVPAPRSRQHPFRSPSPYAQPVTLLSASPRRKKVAGPPRRTPKRSANHRGASPATSETSTLRSTSSRSRASSFAASSPLSRTPSLESFSPSRTPSFGSSGFSSRSSSASSGPTTPTGSPSALPLDLADSAYLDFFGEQYASPAEAETPPEYAPYQMGGKQPYQFAFAGYAA
ncbi:hypothetical protein C8R44DRAFT_884037 [Mycena epipterygia]|nr:hypothetical protein C8R44DRAFT_884037 [Mycena epipterygia]